MRDVARRAGVAVVTVSRVVNGVGTVREETAERVTAAIHAIGYRRNEIARSLRPGQNSLTIGLLLGDLTNPFYASLAKAAVEVANRAGYAVLLSTADEDPDVERRAVGELIGRRVAGLVIVPGQGDHAFLDEINAHDRVPVVFVDRPATGADADVVMVDNEGGGATATQHLIDHGHRRIAILVAPSYYTTGRRLRGYRKALRRNGVPADEDLVVRLRRGTTDDASAATRALLTSARPPTAIFSTTGFLTEGVLRAARGLGAPVAVVGFDDFALADMLPTPVTVVTSDTEELGRCAARRLIDRIDGVDGVEGGEGAPFRRTVLPVRLIARGTGELPPGTQHPL
ncbi:LacI family DNA-binding transcriptional regulator [Streptomyces sp. NPDC091292]|uniref:LacI family DNA-binding transcriptional regulator n=1 Tax=Streptomyces sp. NPDC091292 TaxID=3365991 RepID=UPI003804D5A7